MVLWPELAGNPEAERTTYWKIRRFVTIRSRPAHCLCLPISTYRGKGATKQGMQTGDHAAVLAYQDQDVLDDSWTEEGLKDTPIYVKVEDPSLSIDRTSRINFAKVLTVDYNLRVRNIGRVVGQSIKVMEEYFADTLGLTTPTS
jgi:hypothetical protein